MIIEKPQKVEVPNKLLEKNPLFVEPAPAPGLEDETFTGEQIQMAGVLGPAFRQPLKQAIKEAPSVVTKASETDMGAEAAMRHKEFLERHQLPDYQAPEKVANINLNYLEAPEQVNRVIDDIASMMPEKVDEARRGVQTNEQTRLLAQELGMTSEDLLSRERGEAWNAERIYAARTILATSRDTIDGLAEKINSPEGATPEQMIEFRRALSVYAGVQQQMHGLAAEAGRALQQFKMMAKTGDLKKAEIRMMLDSAGTASTERLASLWTSIDDPAAKAKFAKKAHQATSMDMILEYWINSLLSAPSTHAVNILSNTLVAMWSLPEKAASIGISKVLRDDAIAPSELTAQAWGMYRGSIDGVRLAWQVLKTREPTDPMQKLELREHQAITGENVGALINRGVQAGGKAANWMLKTEISPDEIELSGAAGRFADGLGSFIRLPGTALMAEDEFFKAVAYRMEINALAARQAFQEGLTGKDAADRITQILDEPPESIHMAAMDASRYRTFTSKLGPESKLQGWMTERPALRFIMPFVRTPINILAFSFERIPGLNMLVKRSREDILSGDPVRRDIALGKLAMGSTFMAGAMPFVSEHFEDVEGDFEITGAAPPDPALRSQWKRNHQAYSIRIGDEWYAYNRLDPLGQMLGIMADSVRIMRGSDEQQIEEYAVAISYAISNNLINKTYMSGVAEFFETFTSWDKEAMIKYVKRMGASFLPNIVRRMETQVDPTVRLTDNIIEEFCARTPGCSDKLPPMRNLWGEAIDSGALGPHFISPIFNMKQKYSAIDKELDRLQHPIRMPIRRIMNVEIDNHQYSDYVELQGKKVRMGKGVQISFPDGTFMSITNLNMKEALSKLVKDRRYAKLTDHTDPPGGKVKMLNAVKDLYRSQAQMHLIKRSPELMDQIIARKALEGEAAGMSPFDASTMGIDFATNMRQSLFTNLDSRVDE